MHGAPDRPLSRDAARRDRRGRSDRGALGAGIALSALLHIAVFFLFTFRVDVQPSDRSRVVDPLIRIVPAMQVYDLVEVTGEAAPIAVQIEVRRREQEAERGIPEGDAQSTVEGNRQAGAELDPTSVRDRLRYRLSAPEVWEPPSEERLAELTPQEIVEQRIAAQLAEYNDSVAAEAAARERATDWTKKDADGGRWGVSPGKLHLGGITLPLPVAFAPAPGRREEFAGRVRNWNELQGQAVRVEARETFNDRVKAINERMERERAARNATAADSSRTPSSGNGNAPTTGHTNSGNAPRGN